MTHRSCKAIHIWAQAGLASLVMACGSIASAQTSATQRISEPARPAASRWGPYAIETHKRIEKHLKINRDTFKYKSDLYVELWIDPNGRVTRTRVTGASGNRTVDEVAGPDFPPGLVLPPPAKDMPQPIKVKINADQ